ncbi:unnamed protein product [Hymenolepis diminuta]|uniref:Uncharacterized protein n=1 Tax=Hymenolepis diminuta TaxID=6216 RepID=A0A564YAR0_HYMDI|nr:unnamed protein product [Hymenolepis diminuta]
MCLVSPKKYICAHALTCLTQVTHIKLTLLSRQRNACQLRAPTLLSPPLSVTRCGFLEYIFGLLNSWCSASQLLLALTQTATNWWLLLLS